MLTVTALESADAEGGLVPRSVNVVVLLTGLPSGSGHAPPLVWVGLQTKKSTVPVGTPSPLTVAATTALSVTVEPKVVVTTDGVVVVVVGIVLTVKHSLVPLVPPNSDRAPT